MANPKKAPAQKNAVVKTATASVQTTSGDENLLSVSADATANTPDVISNDVDAPQAAGSAGETLERPSSGVKVVELADKDTGFYDHVTGFKVVRSERRELGDSPGKATKAALASGRLVVVGE